MTRYAWRSTEGELLELPAIPLEKSDFVPPGWVQTNLGPRWVVDMDPPPDEPTPDPLDELAAEAQAMGMYNRQPPDALRYLALIDLADRRRSSTVDHITAIIHLRAEALWLAGDIEALAEERSIAHVRNAAPRVAERLRQIVCKAEYMEASKR